MNWWYRINFNKLKNNKKINNYNLISFNYVFMCNLRCILVIYKNKKKKITALKASKENTIIT